MGKTFRTAMLAAVGAYLVTQKKAKKVVDELVQEGKTSKDETANHMKEFIAKADAWQEEMSVMVEKTVKKVLKDLDLPSRKELEQIAKKLKK